MIRARTSRRLARPLLPVLVVLLGALIGACASSPSTTFSTPTSGAPSSSEPTGGPSPATPTASNPLTDPVGTASATTPGSTDPAATGTATACSGSDSNRAFYAQAAAGMNWAVYCPVLPDGWFLESGTYQLANNGRLEATYRGPEDAHIAIVEGNVCAEFGTDVERCAPRDALIGPATLGDRTGELGRLANGLVLDVDRGADPSWRVTGLGLTVEAFGAIGAAFLRVGG